MFKMDIHFFYTTQGKLIERFQGPSSKELGQPNIGNGNPFTPGVPASQDFLSIHGQNGVVNACETDILHINAGPAAADAYQHLISPCDPSGCDNAYNMINPEIWDGVQKFDNVRPIEHTPIS